MSDKKDELFPVTNSDWNDIIEKNIKQIGESCQGYKWMHISAARSASKKYLFLIYSAIVIPPLGALFGTISAINENNTLHILEIVCGFVGGVLVTIVKYGKFQQRGGEHKNAAAKYASLEGNIRRQLSLYRDDRVNAGKYLQWVSVSFDDLFDGSPLIPGGIYNKWITLATKENLYIPKEYGLTIEVDTHSKIQNLCNVEGIKVNQNISSANLKEIAITVVPTPLKSRPVKSGKETLKRNQTMVFPELNRYADGQMEYEMGRMFGFGQN